MQNHAQQLNTHLVKQVSYNSFVFVPLRVSESDRKIQEIMNKVMARGDGVLDKEGERKTRISITIFHYVSFLVACGVLCVIVAVCNSREPVAARIITTT